MQTSALAHVAVLVVTAVWGSSFFIIKGAVTAMDPFDFLAVRFAIAAGLGSLIFWPRLRGLPRQQWGTGLLLGMIYGAAQVAQTVGLRHTSASISGFITGTYVILTPLLVWVVFRTRMGLVGWGAVLLATAGLGMLGLTGTAQGNLGEALTLLGALLYAVHIVVLSRLVTTIDAVALAAVQLVGIEIICLGSALPGGIVVPHAAGAWGPILYTAVVSGIATMLLQTWAQRHIPPTRAAILMTFEPVFAALFAVLLGGEHLTARIVIGGVLITVASIIGVRAGESEST